MKAEPRPTLVERDSRPPETAGTPRRKSYRISWIPMASELPIAPVPTGTGADVADEVAGDAAAAAVAGDRQGGAHRPHSCPPDRASCSVVIAGRRVVEPEAGHLSDLVFALDPPVVTQSTSQIGMKTISPCIALSRGSILLRQSLPLFDPTRTGKSFQTTGGGSIVSRRRSSSCCRRRGRGPSTTRYRSCTTGRCIRPQAAFRWSSAGHRESRRIGSLPELFAGSQVAALVAIDDVDREDERQEGPAVELAGHRDRVGARR